METRKNQRTAAPGEKKRNKLPPSAILLIVAVVVIAVSMTWGSSAKYLQQTNREAAVKALEFYFTSDYLKPHGESYTLNPDANTVTFELRNYDGDNISEMDIEYTVTASGLNISTTTGTIEAGSKGTTRITLSGLQSGGSYKVSVKGENGYSQTLSATFNVEDTESGVFCNTKVFNDYVLLTIWAEELPEDYIATVNFTIPNGLILDETNDNLEGKEGTKIGLLVDAYTSYTYRLFRTSEYNGADITVNGATPKNLN